MAAYNPRRKIVPPFSLSVAKGDIPGHSIVDKAGRNFGNPAGEEIIWPGGGSIYNWPTSPCALSVQSTSTSDSSGSSGAQTVKITGLDSNWVEISETVTLDGTSAVTSACNYQRVLDMRVITAGSDGKNHGEISACGNGSSLAYISPSTNNAMMAIYTIAASRTGYVYRWWGSINRSQGVSTVDADIKVYVRPVDEVFRLREFVGLSQTGNSQFEHNFPLPDKIDGQTDIYISACISDANTDISAGFDILVIDDN